MYHDNPDNNSEPSHSILKIGTEYPNYEGEIDSTNTFREPSLYRFAVNDNFSDRNTYISGATLFGGPDRVFSEATGSIFDNNKLSQNKDAAGNTIEYLLVAEVECNVLSEGKERKILITKDFVMKNMNEEFEEKKYETTIKENFAYSIVNRLIMQLSAQK